jgi:mannan endo-1,4-beta-mannosidase
VRTVYSGPIVVDIPGWGQETATAIAASPLITDQNIIFSTHVYPQSYNQAAGRYVTPSDVKDLLQQTTRPCIVGEFGDIQADPVGTSKCDVKAVVEAAKATGYEAVYGWAWNGDGGSLNMVFPVWWLNPVATKYTVTSYFWPILNLL